MKFPFQLVAWNIWIIIPILLLTNRILLVLNVVLCRIVRMHDVPYEILNLPIYKFSQIAYIIKIHVLPIQPIEPFVFYLPFFGGKERPWRDPRSFSISINRMQIWCWVKQILVPIRVQFPSIKMTILFAQLHVKHCHIVIANVSTKFPFLENSSNNTNEVTNLDLAPNCRILICRKWHPKFAICDNPRTTFHLDAPSVVPPTTICCFSSILI